MREMKDSGISWIGKIPKDWKCCKQKYAIKLINGRAYSDSEFEISGKYKILRVGNLFSNPVWYTSSMELEPDKYCQKGDLLYSWSMSYAPVIWEGEKVIYHYHIWKTELNKELNKKFTYYYLSSLTDALKAKIHETTMGFITMGIMNNSYIAFPTFSEQRRIADYLDTKCARIDSIRKNVEAEIEALKQYKQSVITEAVTKGLDKNVEMKDSGIPWIGNVNYFFTVTRFKYVATINSNLVNPVLYKEWNQLAPDCIEKNSGKIVIHRTVDEASVDSWNHLFKKGQILYSKIRPVLNKVCIAPYDGLCSADMYPIDTNCDTSFFLYLMLSNYFVSQVDVITRDRIKMPKINQNELGNITIYLPDKHTQREIAKYLDAKCAKIDSIIQKKQELLANLDTYKKSLIYEYVTGKKEVPAV